MLHDVDVQDGLAYLSYWNDGLIVLDVGNGLREGTPSSPTPPIVCACTSANRIYVHTSVHDEFVVATAVKCGEKVRRGDRVRFDTSILDTVNGQRDSLFRGETLRGLLLSAYAWPTALQRGYEIAWGVTSRGWRGLWRPLVWLTAFVGFNLFQSGFTRLCPLESILRRLGVPSAGGACATPQRP